MLFCVLVIKFLGSWFRLRLNSNISWCILGCAELAVSVGSLTPLSLPFPSKWINVNSYFTIFAWVCVYFTAFEGWKYWWLDAFSSVGMNYQQLMKSLKNQELGGLEINWNCQVLLVGNWHASNFFFWCKHHLKQTFLPASGKCGSHF